MLKFFRRIRRKLIDEGNLKRYLVYGAGEILLVLGQSEAKKIFANQIIMNKYSTQ